MTIEEKAHDLAKFSLNILIESRRYTLSLEESVPNILEEIISEYNRIYDEVLKQLNQAQ